MFFRMFLVFFVLFVNSANAGQLGDPARYMMKISAEEAPLNCENYRGLYVEFIHINHREAAKLEASDGGVNCVLSNCIMSFLYKRKAWVTVPLPASCIEEANKAKEYTIEMLDQEFPRGDRISQPADF